MKVAVIILFALGILKWWFTDPTIAVGPNGYELSYTVKYTGAVDQNDRLPMLVALHGNGDTPANFFDSALDQLSAPARIVLIKGVIDRARGSAWPWDKEQYDEFGPLITEAIFKLSQEYPTNGKPILFGFSGGGMFAYYSALHYGSYYSSVIPVSGLLRNGFDESLGANISADVLAYHGRSDDVVSFNGGLQAAKILKAHGAKVQFLEFDGNHHGLFTHMKTDISNAIDRKLIKIGY